MTERKPTFEPQVHVTWQDADGESHELGFAIGPAALEAVRWKFNPSQSEKVTLIKLLSAAAIGVTVAAETAAEDHNNAARCADFAIKDYENAAMWAVKAATTGK